MTREATFTDRVRWASKFLTHGRKIASLTPSSRWLSRAMCREVDSTRPQIILELGAGMGPVTSVIAKMMHPESRLIAIEIDPDLHSVAARRCPDVEVVLGSAADLDAMLDERKIEEVDCLLSCLPTPSLPKSVNHGILDFWSRRCRSEIFTQITQIPWYYLPMYQRAFNHVDFQLVTRNIPPAGVYHCRDLRDDFSTDARLPGKA